MAKQQFYNKLKRDPEGQAYRARERVNNSRRFFNLHLIKTGVVLLCAGFLFFGWADTVEAATYYMRADGTAANKATASGPCSTQANCMSIATHNADTFSAGDTIILCDDGGDYQGIFDTPSSGTDLTGSEITYCPESGDTPKFDGVGVAAWANNFVVDENYIVVDGITFDDEDVTSGVPWNSVFITGDYVKFINCDFDDGTGDGHALKIGPGASYIYVGEEGVGNTFNNHPMTAVRLEADSGEIRHVYVRHNAFDGVGTGGAGGHSAIQASSLNQDIQYVYIHDNTITNAGTVSIGMDGDTSHNLKYVYIYDNTITNSSDVADVGEGIAASGEYIYIYRNTITGGDGVAPWGILLYLNKAGDQHHYVYENDVSTMDGGTYSAGIYVESVTDTTYGEIYIYTNKLYDQHEGIRLGNAIGINSTTQTAAIYNNLCFDNSVNNIRCLDVAGAKIFNNSLSGGGNGIKLESTASNTTIKNNVVYEPSGYLIEVEANSQTEINIDYNVYSDGTGKKWKWGADADDTMLANWQTATSDEANSLDSDPLLTNPSSDDFTLQSTSPCIDAGVDLGVTYDDALHPDSSWPSSVTTVDQDLRGSGWEIGAYGYPVPIASTIGTPSVLTSSSIRWNFTDGAGDETGFRIYDNADTLAVSSATADLTYLDETSLSENTQYTGRYAKAYNTYGESIASSNAASIYTLADTPTNLIASSVGTQNLTVAVDSLPNATLGSAGYYFTNTTNGTNSGWVQTASWAETGLINGTTYAYTVKYRNGDGVETATASLNTATAEETDDEDSTDTEDLEISSVKATATDTTITITWKTDHNAKGYVRYGTDENLTEKKKEDKRKKKHQLTLKNLTPATQYYFRIKEETSGEAIDRSRIHAIATLPLADQESSSSMEKLDIEVQDYDESKKQGEEEKEQTEQLETEKEKAKEEEKKLGWRSYEGELFTTKLFKKDNQKCVETVKFRIVDDKDQPIPNLKVTLCSDPQTVQTDEQGLAVFQNVALGTHTLAFNYQNRSFKKKVAIGGDSDKEGIVKVNVIVIKAVKDPLPWWVWGVMGCLVIAVVWLSIAYFRKKKAA